MKGLYFTLYIIILLFICVILMLQKNIDDFSIKFAIEMNKHSFLGIYFAFFSGPIYFLMDYIVFLLMFFHKKK